MGETEPLESVPTGVWTASDTKGEGMVHEAGQAGVYARRRSYPIVVEVEYRVPGNGKPVLIGRGWTAGLSSAVITLVTAEQLPSKKRIDLSIAWPALLNGTVGLRLCIQGSIVESKTNRVTVQILRYEFRTKSLKRAGVQTKSVFNDRIDPVLYGVPTYCD